VAHAVVKLTDVRSNAKMRTTLEFRQPAGQLWVTLENDTEQPVNLESIEVSVRYAGRERAVNVPHLVRHFGPGERFQLELTNYFREAVHEAFPALPNGEEIEIVLQPILGNEGGGAAPRAEYRARIIDGRFVF
jgi:hypothetical protein